MRNYLKFIVISNPLQGLRLVDTFPWMMLITPKKWSIHVHRVPLFVCSLILIFAAFLLGENIRSTAKILLFLVFMVVALFSKTQSFQINGKLLLILFFLLLFEDLLINYFGLHSPLVRDERGALFIFREKSYVALLVGFLVSYLPVNRSTRWRDLLVLVGIFYLLGSALGWLIYIIYFYHRFQITARYLPPTSLIVFVSFSLLYLAFELVRAEGLVGLISASDALRFLINLESLHVTHVGSIYLHDAVAYSSEVLDIKKGYFLDWDNLTPQAPFFILAYFFGSYGFIVAGLFFVFYMRALPNNSRYTVGFIHSMILINIFVQGFMLSPYLLGYLFMSSRREN